MTSIVNEVHFAEFVRLAKSKSGWMGSVPLKWARSLHDCADISVPSVALRRSELREFCLDAANETENCFIACMAWGGMNRRHGNTAWSQRARWIPILDRLRGGGVSRKEAYELLHRLNVQGLGPAYFTKLIFFLRPETNGYILDQWTGKSISLIFSPDVISITANGWVNRDNDASSYEIYCQLVEEISIKISVPPETVEEMLFSQGGRQKQEWRQYVVEKWGDPSVCFI